MAESTRWELGDAAFTADEMVPWRHGAWSWLLHEKEISVLRSGSWEIIGD